jgi:hypothetical protein
LLSRTEVLKKSHIKTGGKKMKKNQGSDEINAEIKVLVKNLHDLADGVSLLENQITRMSASSLQSTSSIIKSSLPMFEHPEFAAATNHRTEYSKSNIIPFSRSGVGADCGSEIPRTKQPHAALPYLAAPGSPLPGEIPDYRTALQRDGLILLGWDKRFTETGERYTAYWVTSAGVARFYASRPLLLADFPFAVPDHKSYAAEDGIEFYGQKAPAYIVHVAPDLMMSNPKHGELRAAHINMLRLQGSKVNFNYKYLLKTEKSRKMPAENSVRNKAG